MDRAGRFRADRWQLGLTHLTCAKLLGVSVRTIHNWEAARARVPHAAFKLLRMLASGRHLVSPAWDNFHVQGDVLVTPEGHRFPAQDLTWWSLAMRQAEAFRSLSRKQREQQRSDTSEGSEAGRQAGTEPPAGAAVALSLLQQVRSAASSLPGRKARREVLRTAGDGSQSGRPKPERVQQAAAPRGLATDVLSAPICEGERGSHSLTPQSGPKSAARRTGGAL